MPLNEDVGAESAPVKWPTPGLNTLNSTGQKFHGACIAPPPQLHGGHTVNLLNLL